MKQYKEVETDEIGIEVNTTLDNFTEVLNEIYNSGKILDLNLDLSR